MTSRPVGCARRLHMPPRPIGAPDLNQEPHPPGPHRSERCAPSRPIASTTHCAPNRIASSSISSGRCKGRRVDRDLVRPASSTAWASSTESNPAADRERHEHLVRGAPRQLHDRVALLVRSGDIQEHQLVRTFAVVVGGELDPRVAGVADVDEFGRPSLRRPASTSNRELRASDACAHRSDRRISYRARPGPPDGETPLVQRLADDYALQARLPESRSPSRSASCPIPPSRSDSPHRLRHAAHFIQVRSLEHGRPVDVREHEVAHPALA